MGFLSKVLMAPFAPVSGVIWLAERLEEQAQAVYRSPEAIRAELDQIAASHACGEIDTSERDRLEEGVLARFLEGSDG